MTYVSAQLRREVIERAEGCCEYCRTHQDDVDLSFHIEHVLATKHGGQTASGNLCLSCARCNQYKGSNIPGADPETGDPTFLFHPRRHQWSEHFRLDGATIEALTAEGRVTILILRLNSPERLAERQLLIRAKRYPCTTN